MSENTSEIHAGLVKRAAQLAKVDASFANFLRLTTVTIDEQDLKGFTVDGFETLLRHSFSRLNQRKTKDHLINIWTPDAASDAEPDARSIQIVDVFVADMPFLVDSILGAIRAKGGNIRLIAHPVLPVGTNKKQLEVLAEASSESTLESFLQVHIDPITDKKLLTELFDEIDAVLIHVKQTVRGWRAMLERLRQLVQGYRQHPPKISGQVLAETMHFLAWLADHNFTFLGMREYRLNGEGRTSKLEPVANTGLGILEDPNFFFLRHGADYVEMTEQHVAFLRTKEPLMVTKANVRSKVHRRGHMDYIGVKLYDDSGKLSGELRIVGLFTSMSLATPHTEVPFIRSKISEVMRHSGHDPRSHAGKALMAALDNYPREELFQISGDELFEFVTIISTLPDRPRIRVLPRIDRFDNFVSILLYLPRDRYTSEVRALIGEHLATAYDGRVSAYYPHFPEGDLVRVHYIIGRNGGPTPRVDRIKLEQEVASLTRTFGDRLLEAAEDPGAIVDYWDAFSTAYQAQYDHTDALADIAIFKSLASRESIAVRLSRIDNTNGAYSLKVYHGGAPISLSDRVPMLENFGFKVISERTYPVCPRDGEERFLHDMLIHPHNTEETGLTTIGPILETALLAVWNQDAESDGFNQLTVSSALSWDDVSILRALARYLKQIGTAHSQRYMWTALSAYPDIASKLVTLFQTLHQPDFDGDRDKAAARLIKAITNALADITSADEDMIIRHFLNLIEASLRTNFFQRDDNGERRPALAIKFDPSKIDGMPEPRPYREIFVYSPRVEGVHLRGGSIARGGLRWSDRPEDFRTEILGLAKAQMVKNAVIVPVGAKGGFVPKIMPANPDRDTFITIGTACYKIFIGALLDITDNLNGDKIVPPASVVRRDGDDPYLVVAADKGTATFSDTANAISESRGFWLSDAFASGGSAGYDHKKMGITARGGWEAVKRHFREMDHDIQSKPFTTVGIGDMSGDVFGNGMLLSRYTRVVAAFDHRDIFIDPNPVPETSFLERRRLFEMGRSSWQDYDKSLLSKGGGIFPRSAKSLELSPQAREALGFNSSSASLTPQVVMNAILKADVDLLWFGGIGTYIRSSHETDTDAGDRANDAIRITGKDVRAKVIGEGANLGMTHRARIEYAQAGGRINTDAIDNSAGVNSSDLEVNIKIALGALIRNDTLKIEDRNSFLVEMTDEVAELCLRNNYLQTLAISLTERRGMEDFPDLIAFLQDLEARDELDREVEFLPDDVELVDRTIANQPFTRPEIAVLLAYAKNTLYADLLESEVPDDPYLSRELYRYFPKKLKDRYPLTIDNHRLRREVIATVLANAMINRGGATFVHLMGSTTGANPAHIAYAFAAARDAFALTDLNRLVDTIDNQLQGETQLELYAEIQTLQVNQTLWFLRNVGFEDGLSGIVERYRDGVAQVRAVLGNILPKFIAKSVADQAVGFVNGGTPRDLARRIAELSALTLASDIVLVAERNKASVAEATQAYFTVLEAFKLGRITEQGGRLVLSDKFDRMALDRALANVMRAQRDLTGDVLSAGKGTIPDRFATWRETRGAEVERIIAMVVDLTEGDLTVSRLSVAAGLLSDLVRI